MTIEMQSSSISGVECLDKNNYALKNTQDEALIDVDRATSF